jgi:hypothetical protein
MFSNSKKLKEAQEEIAALNDVIDYLQRESRRVGGVFEHLLWAPQSNWEAVDGKSLKAFFASETGQRLQAVLRNAVLFKQQSAINKMSDKESARALGFREAIAYIDTLQEQTEFHEEHPSADVDATLDSIHP